MPRYETGLGSTGFPPALSAEPLPLEPPLEDEVARSSLPDLSESSGANLPMSPRTISAAKTDAPTIRPVRLGRGPAGWKPGRPQPGCWKPDGGKPGYWKPDWW